MEDIEKFEYKGNEITFQLGNGETMVNATQMAKAFGKLPSEFLRLPSTVSYIEALRDKGLSLNIDTQVVTTVKGNVAGGVEQGTWMIRPLALKFAAWLSPEFEVWVYDRIDELTRLGATAINPEDLLTPDYMIKVMLTLKAERAEKELAQAKVTKMEPKALFADAVIASEKSCLVGELAKILKQNGIEIGQNKLFIWLRDKSYLGTKGEYRNLPTQKAMNLGLFKIKKSTKELNNGSILLCTTTTVTAKGQIYFINKFLDRKKKRLLRKNKNPQKNKPDLLF